jgi:cobalt/nickel transport system permease protein
MAQIADQQLSGNPYHHLDGRIKTLLGIAAIVVVVVLKHWVLPVIPLFAAIIFLCGSVISCAISVPKLLLRLIAPFSIAWLVLLSLLFTYGHTEIGHITLFSRVLPMYREGLDWGFLIMLRVLAAVSITTLLSIYTPMPEILATLRIVKIPDLMVDLADMIYRYITLMDEEAHTMRRAQLSRGGASAPWYQQTRDLGVVAGMMMLKALDRSTQIYKAMLSRGFDENSASPPYFENAIPRYDMIVGLLGGLILIGLLAIDLLTR